MKVFILSLVVASTFITSTAFANKEVGNGGDGVVIGDKVYLFDLYESYNHLNPSLPLEEAAVADLESLSSRFQEIRNAVQGNYSSGSTKYDYEQFIRELAKKVTELKKTDLLFGYSVQRALLAHSWAFVPYQLNNIQDDDGSDVELPGELVQIAVRSYRSIKFDNSLVKKMDLSNLIATIMHEAVYSLLQPELQTEQHNGKMLEYMKQPSRRAREIVSYLFSGPLTQASLRNIVLGSIPVGPAFGVSLIGKEAGFLAYDFKIKEVHFNPMDKKSLQEVFSKECAKVKSNDMNHITFLYVSIYNYSFYSFIGKSNVEKYYFGGLNDNKFVQMNVIFDGPATKDICIEKMLEKFSVLTSTMSSDPLKVN